MVEQLKILDFNQYSHLKNVMWRLASPKAKNVFHIACSNYMKKYFKETYEEEVDEVIEFGLDLDYWKEFPKEIKQELKKKYNLPENKKIGIIVSRFKPEKWLLVPLIINELGDKDYHWIIVLAEKNTNFTDIKSENVTIFNYADKKVLRELYNCVDFGLFASSREGFCLAACECLACNTPIVASKTGIFFDMHLSPDFDYCDTYQIRKEKVLKYNEVGEPALDENGHQQFEEIEKQIVKRVQLNPIAGEFIGCAKNFDTGKYNWDYHLYVDAVKKLVSQQDKDSITGEITPVWYESRKVLLQFNISVRNMILKWKKLLQIK